MRGYSFHNEDSLSEYGNNLSGVLYNLCRTNEMKERVLEFVRDLPNKTSRTFASSKHRAAR